jgi:BolA protein
VTTATGPARAAWIEQRLRATLDPVALDIEDESHKHAGHAGAKSGGGHFRMRIVSPQFSGLDAVARHRLVYQALGEAMGREIHALSIQALAPGET